MLQWDESFNKGTYLSIGPRRDRESGHKPLLYLCGDSSAELLAHMGVGASWDQLRVLETLTGYYPCVSNMTPFQPKNKEQGMSISPMTGVRSVFYPRFIFARYDGIGGELKCGEPREH